MNEPQNHTGQMIREARKKAGLTQKELAQRLGISASAITKMETGSASPSINTLERIAAAMGKRLVIGIE